MAWRIAGRLGCGAASDAIRIPLEVDEDAEDHGAIAARVGEARETGGAPCFAIRPEARCTPRH